MSPETIINNERICFQYVSCYHEAQPFLIPKKQVSNPVATIKLTRLGQILYG